MESPTKCPTVLLKADTEADVNLMNPITLDILIHDRTVLELTSLRMEAYGNNTAVTTVFGKLPCLSQVEGSCLQTSVLCDKC